jgi:ribosomal protein S18 acetylase RimI-like enzyme
MALIFMDEQTIILRSAKPTFAEGLIYSRYLDQAAEGFFRFMLGRRVADIIAIAYTQPDHDFSYQNVTFAEHDGVIVGMVSGYSAEQHRLFSEQPLKKAAGKWALRMRGVRILCAPLWGLLNTLADGDFYLQAIAVDKELRGEGIGSTLIDFIEDRARATGATKLSLDVSAKNEGARRLYEHRGMTVESGWPRFLFLPQLLVRMTKLL